MPKLASNKAAPEWFDASVEKRLERFSLQLRRGSLAGGELRGVTRGGQLEFVEHRPYATGDDLKWLDWNVYGRLGRLHVKTFAMEAAARIDLLIDGSASMALDLPQPLRTSRREDPARLPATPFEAALLAATCVAYLALRGSRKGSGGGHRLRLAVSDARSRSALRWLPSRHSPAGFLALLADLAKEGKAPPAAAQAERFAPALAEAARMLPPSGLAMVFSDGYDQAALMAALARLAQSAARRVVFVHLANDTDPLGDAAGRLEGALRLIDSETQAELPIEEVEALRDAYRNAYVQHVEAWRGFCLRHGIAHVQVQAGRGLVESLLAQLNQSTILG